ncbi:MAG: hypothetical protein DRR16_25765 [Candidatus Parabeggiatoa sp. nov. 3]|nr:MAG: hypothetical protein DRR16_25765 [Gammaproteobacteria bacterium]
MKVLLDECLPKKLKRDFVGYEVNTVPEMGWAGIKNGALLTLAEPQFDVFITIDNNLRYQQNLKTIQLVIVVLNATDSKFETLRPLIPSVLSTLETTSQTGQVLEIKA